MATRIRSTSRNRSGKKTDPRFLLPQKDRSGQAPLVFRGPQVSPGFRDPRTSTIRPQRGGRQFFQQGLSEGPGGTISVGSNFRSPNLSLIQQRMLAANPQAAQNVLNSDPAGASRTLPQIPFGDDGLIANSPRGFTPNRGIPSTGLRVNPNFTPPVRPTPSVGSGQVPFRRDPSGRSNEPVTNPNTRRALTSLGLDPDSFANNAQAQQAIAAASQRRRAESGRAASERQRVNDFFGRNFNPAIDGQFFDGRFVGELDLADLQRFHGDRPIFNSVNDGELEGIPRHLLQRYFEARSRQSQNDAFSGAGGTLNASERVRFLSQFQREQAQQREIDEERRRLELDQLGIQNDLGRANLSNVRAEQANRDRLLADQLEAAFRKINAQFAGNNAFGSPEHLRALEAARLESSRVRSGGGNQFGVFDR